MAGDAQFGPAPDSGAPQRAATPQISRDPVALREAVHAALARGESVGRAYADVVRPILATALADDRRALPRALAHAALAELCARLPSSDEGLGRRAVVLVPPGPVGELDARALADGLDAGGWMVELIELAGDAAEAVGAIVALRAELVALPVADAAQALASQPACALLRRVSAPPLIVGVAFGEADAPAVAADHVVGSVDALPALLRRRLAGGGHGGAVPWGVRLHRDAGGLIVAPVGLLDTVSVARLREIVETRRTMYPKILIDLSELLAADEPGLTALVSWDAEQPWDPTVAALGDARTVAALDSAGLRGTLPLSLRRA